MNLKKKLSVFCFFDIWRGLTVLLRYALGMGTMQKAGAFSKTVVRRPVFDEDLCSGCKLCAKVCPAKAVCVQTTFRDGENPSIFFDLSRSRCVSCGLCVEACPENALKLKGK